MQQSKLSKEGTQSTLLLMAHLNLKKLLSKNLKEKID